MRGGVPPLERRATRRHCCRLVLHTAIAPARVVGGVLHLSGSLAIGLTVGRFPRRCARAQDGSRVAVLSWLDQRGHLLHEAIHGGQELVEAVTPIEVDLKGFQTGLLSVTLDIFRYLCWRPLSYRS